MKNKRKKKENLYCTDRATTTGKDWGFNPVPCKGGKTTNFDSWKMKGKEE